MSESYNDDGGERKFLHDISSPLGTLVFVADSLLEIIESQAVENPDAVALTKDMILVLDKIKNILAKRREILINR